MIRYRVNPNFLPVLFSMGEAPQSAEQASSNFASSCPLKEKTADLQYCTYELSYIEENKRSKESPWSVRHIGVYHHRDPGRNFDLWILLCPNPDGPVQRMLGALKRGSQDALRDFCADPSLFHMWLSAHYSDNMRWYLRALGDQVVEQVIHPLFLSLLFRLPSHF